MSAFIAYTNRLRSFSLNAKLWVSSSVLVGLGWSVSNVLLNLYLVQLGYREDAIGSFSFVTSLLMGLVAIPAGLALRHRSRKPSIVASSLMAGALGFVQVTWPTELILIATNAALGAFQAILVVSESPFIMENSKPEERSHIFSLNFVAIFAMFVVGSAVAGQLPSLMARQLGVGVESVAAYRYSLMIGVVFRLLATVPLLFVTETNRQLHKAENRRQVLPLPSAVAISKLLRVRVFWALGCGLFQPFLTVMLKTRLGASAETVGAIVAATNVGVTVACLLTPSVEKLLGTVPAIAVSIIAAAPMLMVVGWSGSLLVVAVAMVLRDSIAMLGGPLRQRFTMEIVTKDERSLMASLEQVSWQIPWALGSWAGGQVISRYGYGLLFSLSAGLYALSGVLYGTMFKPESQRLVEARANGQLD